jgi:NADH-quinone oxidoreductase subunit L
MTAFYMFRLMAMTFYGGYRGPAWEVAGHGSAAAHAAHGHAAVHDHASHAQVAHAGHGPGDPHDAHGGGGHGHGPWHGPHESPKAMTYPLMALAAGACIVGFFGLPPALWGTNPIEHFLEPSFTASAAHEAAEPVAAAEPGAPEAHAETAAAGEAHGAEHGSIGVERALMFFSVVVALIGIGAAWRFYVTRPDTSERLAQQFAGAHRTLSNKYYVDELYNGTVVAGTMAGAKGLWTFDRNVVDGGVNGTGWITLFSSWLSGLTDRYVVDGAVNMVGWSTEESSFWFRRLQTGLVQNYALLMVFGVFVFVSVYLILR